MAGKGCSRDSGKTLEQRSKVWGETPRRQGPGPEVLSLEVEGAALPESTLITAVLHTQNEQVLLPPPSSASGACWETPSSSSLYMCTPSLLSFSLALTTIYVTLLVCLSHWNVSGDLCCLGTETVFGSQCLLHKYIL